jgi:CheY-like chemotaxis protein/anti-sigma regulatory factor (Ser/Thr protein kinase)
MPRILVVEPSQTAAARTAALLRDARHEVALAADAAGGLAAVRSAAPDLVVADWHLPDGSGPELARAVRAEFPALPVVIVTDRGSEDLAVDALKAGAAGYLPKRRLDDDLLPLADELLAVAGSRQKLTLFLGGMTAAEHRFTLASDPDLVPPLVGHLDALLRHMGLFDEAVRMRVGVAVHEAVVNGIVHGNLGVGSELKDGDWQAYNRAIAERQRQEPYARRRIHVTLRAAKGPHLEVRVRDEGPGYDPAALPDPTDPANLEKGSGRGLLLIRTFFDEVSHNAAGNEIVMVKKCQ